MAWHYVPYQPVTRRGRVGRGLHHLPSQVRGGPLPWDEWALPNGTHCLVHSRIAAVEQAISALSGVTTIPALGLTETLGELTGAQRRAFVSFAEDATGETDLLPKIKAYLGDADLARLQDVRLASAFQFICRRRARTRLDENGESVVVPGEYRAPAKPLPGLFAGGAFPTVTTIRDEFDGSGNPPSGWTSPAYQGDGTIAESSGTLDEESTYTNGVFDAVSVEETEARASAAATHNGGECGFLGRWTNEDSGNENGFVLYMDGSDWYWYDYSSGSFGQTGASASETGPSSGDDCGIEITGSTLNGYINTGSGWTQVLSRTDASHNNAGKTGLEAYGMEWDDFIAGEISSGTSITLDASGLFTLGSASATAAGGAASTLSDAGLLTLGSAAASAAGGASSTLDDAGLLTLGGGDPTTTAGANVSLDNAGLLTLGSAAISTAAGSVISLAAAGLLTLGAGAATVTSAIATVARRYGGMLLRFVK